MIHDDLKEQFPEAEFKYTGGISLYQQKHKFLKMGGQGERWVLQILRHFDNDYRIPVIDDKNISSKSCRTYKVGSYSTAHNRERYNLLLSKVLIRIGKTKRLSNSFVGLSIWP